MLCRLLRPLLLVVPLATVLGCAQRLDTQGLQRFEQAQAAFDTAQTPADFIRVAGMYQELVDGGICSGAVYYNQGNAYMRAGQRGRAIACYRQAQRYLPSDPQLDANLRFALPGSAPVPRHSWGDYVLFWQDWISYPGKFQLTLVFASSAFLAGLLAEVGRWSSLRPVAWACLLATLAMMASAVHDWNRYERRQHGVVAVGETLARKGNADSYEAAFTVPLAEGTEFLVQERRGGWIRLQLAGGEEGWVRERDVAVY